VGGRVVCPRIVLSTFLPHYSQHVDESFARPVARTPGAHTHEGEVENDAVEVLTL
jgi:hypothetical protein